VANWQSTIRQATDLGQDIQKRSHIAVNDRANLAAPEKLSGSSSLPPCPESLSEFLPYQSGYVLSVVVGLFALWPF
jgi:hypothetical protein